MTQPFTAAVVQDTVWKWAVAVFLYSQYAFLKQKSMIQSWLALLLQFWSSEE